MLGTFRWVLTTRNHPGVSVYFDWQQSSDLASFILANNGHVVVIGHSYGADTAAAVVASLGLKVDVLLTLDPVSIFRPDYVKVAANANSWIDYNAVGGSSCARQFRTAGARRRGAGEQ